MDVHKASTDDLPNYCPGCGSDYPWIEPIEKHQMREDEFLQIPNEEISGEFYIQLINEINLCYRVGANNATYILNRKLLKNLIYDSLRAYYDQSDHLHLYYNKEKGRRRGFGSLIESLKESIDEFRRDTAGIDQDFIRSINEFKDRGNSSAHTVEQLMDDEEIVNKSSEATYVARVLFKLRENIHTQDRS